MCYHTSAPGRELLKEQYPGKLVIYDKDIYFHVSGFERPFLQGRQLPERSTGTESVGQEDRDTEGGAGHQQQGHCGDRRRGRAACRPVQRPMPSTGPTAARGAVRSARRRADDFGHRRGEQRLLGAQHRRHCSDPQDHHDAQDEDAER